MQKTKLQQKAVGQITYQQINFIKLLQVASADMPARILKEVEENPMLEQAEETAAPCFSTDSLYSL